MKQKSRFLTETAFFSLNNRYDYIMPGIPPPIGGICGAGFSSL